VDRAAPSLGVYCVFKDDTERLWVLPGHILECSTVTVYASKSKMAGDARYSYIAKYHVYKKEPLGASSGTRRSQRLVVLWLEPDAVRLDNRLPRDKAALSESFKGIHRRCATQ